MHVPEVFLTIPLVSELEGINPLWGTSHLPKCIELAEISLWLRSVDGDWPTNVKDATTLLSAIAGTWTPGSRKSLPVLCIQAKASATSQTFYESEDTVTKPATQSVRVQISLQQKWLRVLSSPINNLIRTQDLIVLAGYAGERGKESLKTRCIYLKWKY